MDTAGTSQVPRGQPEPRGPVVVVLDQVNVYQTSLLEGICGVLLPAGIPLVVYANDSFAREVRPTFTRLLRLPGVQGIVTTILSDAASHADVVTGVAHAGLPSVSIGEESNGWSIGTDNAVGMHALMCHLLDEAGATRIAIVRGVEHHPDAREREEVVRAELRVRGLSPTFVLEGGFDRDIAYTATARALKAGGPPDAFVALNDRSAAGVMDALDDVGLRVPEDVMVTGFDDDAIARECEPALTTINQDLVVQGAVAAHMLVAQLRGATPPGHVAHPGRLVVRGSTVRNTVAAIADVERDRAPDVRSRAQAAMDRAQTLNRIFMACRSIKELLDELSANMSRLRLRRCFIVLNENLTDGESATGVLVLNHTEHGTEVTLDAEPFLLSGFLPTHVRDEITHGSLTLQPLSVETRELGYVLFEQMVPDRFVGELLRTDLSRAIDSLHRSQRHAQSVESSVALRTEELRQTNDELLKLTKLDGLTGIANRAAFDTYLQEQWAAHVADGGELSMLLIDVDHFKQHNDQHGHVDGDKCLRRLAQSIRESVWSPGDLAARYGGDEFIAVLPHTSATGASVVAARVRDSLTAFKESPAGAVTPLFTVSIGAATMRPRASMNPSEFVALADSALYAAKSAGRDRTATALDQGACATP